MDTNGFSRKERKERKGFNVAIVGMLPVPMLPVSNWVLVLAIGNTFRLATLSNPDNPVNPVKQDSTTLSCI